MGNELMLQNILPCVNTDYPWALVGPVNTGTSTLGIVMAVAVHPTNSLIIYAGTQASGLWRTENGGTTWQNVTDVLNLPALGISWIEFDPAMHLIPMCRLKVVLHSLLKEGWLLPKTIGFK
ncbi:MAG: hypothetical protein SGJ00_02515 [bacterium]|nr:hypothetical protein [bacterium]